MMKNESAGRTGRKGATHCSTPDRRQRAHFVRTSGYMTHFFPTRSLALALACLAAPMAVRAQATTEPAVALALSPDGRLVVDTRARLAWPRCVEGMQWNGRTCTGTPLELDYAQALAHAQARWKAENLPWRLPRAAELRRLVDKSASTPGLDARLFPAAPSGWHWASNTNVQGGLAGNQYNYGNVERAQRQGQGGESLDSTRVNQRFAVDLETGDIRSDAAKYSKLHFRLVRTYTDQ